eukprot:TRINITY_DN20374_c0_g1_i1.p1 TRINITY_DN20374_c0_g1~~TRINITY_DN20374_c0_g1_i1.p1  ORF type:complete len:133 (+),score=9.56 TRINITY_DN20374_c0_g1_i1:72-470(+)
MDYDGYDGDDFTGGSRQGRFNEQSRDRESWESRQRRKRATSPRRRAVSPRDSDYNYESYSRSTRPYPRSTPPIDYDDDTPRWPMYLGICLWIVMGITLIVVWYDENYGLWEDTPKEPEAPIQLNEEMLRPEF